MRGQKNYFRRIETFSVLTILGKLDHEHPILKQFDRLGKLETSRELRKSRSQFLLAVGSFQLPYCSLPTSPLREYVRLAAFQY